MHSQYGEEKIILDYFKDFQGRFLDVGAYDGKTFSNTYALAERGWEGVLVEASPQCFVQMMKSVMLQSPKMKLMCAAVDVRQGCAKFYDSGGAVATLKKEHMEKWKANQGDFREIYVATVTPLALLKILPGPYHFISLDIEGNSVNVLAAIPNLKELGVKLFCVEALQTEYEEVEHLFSVWGYVLHAETPENRLYRVAE